MCFHSCGHVIDGFLNVRGVVSRRTFLPVETIVRKKKLPDDFQCSGALYLLLPQLCTESPEQWPEKFRKMPLCSDSRSRDSWMWSTPFSRLDGGLVPELGPLVSTLEDAEELDASEPVQCMSSPREGSGRMQGDGCCDWTGWGHFSLG